MAGKGLYYNINKKREEGRKMRKKGAKGAPTAADFKLAAKTARKASGGAVTKKIVAVRREPRKGTVKGGFKITIPKSARSGQNTTKGPNPRDMMQSIFKEYHKSMGRRK